MLTPLPLPRFEVVRAARALRDILRDPDDLPKVFTLIESLSGTAPHRMLLAFKLSQTGRRLLADQPDIGRTLSDRGRLRAMPPGSLGRAYLAFVEREGISADGIRDASVEGRVIDAIPEPFRYVTERMRDTHDLWHAATGYQGDVLGELSLLAFSLGQHWNTGVAMIVLGGVLKGFGHGDTSTVLDGYRRGRAAAFMPSLDWEALLPLQVEEVRRRLRLEAPAAYTPIRTADLRADGIV